MISGMGNVTLNEGKDYLELGECSSFNSNVIFLLFTAKKNNGDVIASINQLRLSRIELKIYKGTEPRSYVTF